LAIPAIAELWVPASAEGPAVLRILEILGIGDRSPRLEHSRSISVAQFQSLNFDR
jgi:hypothetical protein